MIVMAENVADNGGGCNDCLAIDVGIVMEQPPKLCLLISRSGRFDNRYAE